jgi:hypothetical protein
MGKAAEYRAHAAECRRAALATGKDKHREGMMRIAAIWDQLALEREQLLEVDVLEAA